MRIFTLVFILSVFSSCSNNSSGGITFGQARSPAWFQTAPSQDIYAHYDSFSVVGLCNLWSENHPGRRLWKINRHHIGLALERKNQDPLLCNNPEQDEANKAIAEANKAKKEAQRQKNIAKRAVRDACEARYEAYYACRSSQSTFSAGIAYCRRPRC